MVKALLPVIPRCDLNPRHESTFREWPVRPQPQFAGHPRVQFEKLQHEGNLQRRRQSPLLLWACDPSLTLASRIDRQLAAEPPKRQQSLAHLSHRPSQAVAWQSLAPAHSARTPRWPPRYSMSCARAPVQRASSERVCDRRVPWVRSEHALLEAPAAPATMTCAQDRLSVAERSAARLL